MTIIAVMMSGFSALPECQALFEHFTRTIYAIYALAQP